MAEILRPKTEVEPLQIAGLMWQSGRTLLPGGVRTEHPDWNPDQVNREIALRICIGLVGHDSV